MGLIDNLVNCESARKAVEPVSKTKGVRYEDCPHRQQNPTVSTRTL
ncbi:MAG TPA: hypothetical protein VGE31_00730 [Candidatus Paceibacterota bacterium]